MSYKIVYSLGLKLINSHIVREEKIGGSIELQSELGTFRFCEEQSPFVSISILLDGLDVTEKFKGHFEMIASRYSAIREGGIPLPARYGKHYRLTE